jgi:hypothetical protein
MRSRPYVFLFVIMALSGWAFSPAFSQARPDGSDFLVNGYTTGKQRDPGVARGDDGTFLVVWRGSGPTSGNAIFGRRMDQGGQFLGSEFQISSWTTAISPQPPVVASRGAEGFVVVWEDSVLGGPQQEVLAVLLNATGARLGVEFSVNEDPNGDQGHPRVAGRDDGGFVVVWEDESGLDGDGYGIRGAIFDSTGAPLASELQVNSYTTGSQSGPDVGLSGSGEFLVAWTSIDQDGDDRGIFAQAFEADGDPSGGEFQANTFMTAIQYDAQVGADRSGNFVVVWSDYNSSYSHDGSNSGIFAQFADASGALVGPEFQVNTYTIGPQRFPSVVMNEHGEAVISWISSAQDGDFWGVFAQRYDPSGAPRGEEFQVNTYTTGAQLHPALAMEDSGEFVVVFEDRNGGYTDYDVYARRYEGPGPSMTSHLDGDMVDCSDPLNSRPSFAWSTDNYDQFKIFMGSSPGFEKGTRVTSGDKWIKTTSWMPNRKKWKKTCRKALDASPLSPLLYVSILARDNDLSKSSPSRQTMVDAIELDVTP